MILSGTTQPAQTLSPWPSEPESDFAPMRWQIAELTESEICRMSRPEMARMISCTASPGSRWTDVESNLLLDERQLRRLVRLVRITCRRQGY